MIVVVQSRMEGLSGGIDYIKEGTEVRVVDSEDSYAEIFDKNGKLLAIYPFRRIAKIEIKKE